ncbi:MAG TPA: ribose-5-phosphate isomerase RpiA [Bryobacteraceae bacterium]|nr:ribose-5-phosphate isomerase RpiA [Bryobacteraceae bacterium]
MNGNEDKLKMAAAESAVALVTDGMVVGLGTGSTSTFAVNAIGRRVKEGLRIVGVPTSERTAAQARGLGIPVVTLAEQPSIDVTIDGADQVEEGSLNLIKGYGGALLREKIVASASKKLAIIVHESKLASRLITDAPIPVEVVRFGWQATVRHLEKLGAQPGMRMNPDGQAFVTDGGNHILDCRFAPGTAADRLAEALDHVVGVVEHGLFIGMTTEVHVAGASGVRVLR